MKKSFLILSLLALTFIACPPPEPQPKPEKPTLSKIDITDAAALFVEPSGTDAGKIFKIKKDLTTIEEVKYTNTDGSSADMGSLKASYVINAHNDYAIIGFAADPNKAKTYDFELVADKAYLVRKSDGKVFSELINLPSTKYILSSQNYIYYHSGAIQNDTGVYYYGNNIVKVDVIPKTEKIISPSYEDKFGLFFIDKNNNIVYMNKNESLSLISPDDKSLSIVAEFSFPAPFGWMEDKDGYLTAFNSSSGEQEYFSEKPFPDYGESDETTLTPDSYPFEIHWKTITPYKIYSGNEFFICFYKNLPRYGNGIAGEITDYENVFTIHKKDSASMIKRGCVVSSYAQDKDIVVYIDDNGISMYGTQKESMAYLFSTINLNDYTEEVHPTTDNKNKVQSFIVRKDERISVKNKGEKIVIVKDTLSLEKDLKQLNVSPSDTIELIDMEHLQLTGIPIIHQ